jgi:uncharacterized protein involved in response to NO
MLLRLGPAKPNSKKVSIFLALILTLACFPDEMEYWSLGPWSRAIAISWIAVFYWRIFESSPFTSWLSRGVRLSAISVLLGSFLLALDFTHKMEWLHLIYISGFGLLTFMVASRVILAHGGHDMKLEIKNWRITFAVVLIFIAGATRAFAPFYPPLYQRHLAYSAICFVLAVVIWGWSFIPKLKIKETFS